MEREKVFAYTKGCYSGELASCSYACPFHLNLRSFLKKVAQGRWDSAYKELQAAVLFPSLVSALCPRPCENSCQRQTVFGNDPIAVGHIERACVSNAQKKEAIFYPISPKTERVAVLGAGPSGLSCALLLAQKRFKVTVFEKGVSWGGSLHSHPCFTAFANDFSLSFSTVNVEFHFNTEIKSLATLNEFDTVVIATGIDGEHFGLLNGWNEALCCTSEPRIFLVGELTGVPLMHGMAQAVRTVRAIEAFIQSGSSASAMESRDMNKCTRFAPHANKPDMPGIIPTGSEYTAEEAKAEAARCMLCDCTACMEACELLVHYKKKPPRIGNDIFMDGQSRNSVSTASITRQTWSCNLCGRCETKCAEGVDLRSLFQLSRSDRVGSGNYPPAFHDYWLREMEFFTTVGNFISSPPGQVTCEYAFFPGCRLGASNPEYVIKSADFLSQTLNAGIFLNCCGVPAFWAGEDTIFQKHLAELKVAWEKLGKPTLVTACATCGRLLEQFLSEIPIISLYDILAKEKVVSALIPFTHAAVFDPCAVAGKSSIKKAVRLLASSNGIVLSDYDSDGKCCGFGGHMQLANPCLYDKITKNRATCTDEPNIVYCSNCREVFASKGKECAHILDVVFGLKPCGVPTLEEKKENSMALKKELMKTYKNKSYEPPRNLWDSLSLIIMPETQQKMERRLITLNDVRETVWRAEEMGEGFISTNGDILCSMVGKAVTYWVLYRKTTEPKTKAQFTVIDVYCHRMRPREED